MAAVQIIERLDGSWVRAVYVRHVRTLTKSHGGGNDDIDVYRLDDGTEIECICPDDARAKPREVDTAADHYPGYRAGE